MRRSTPRGPHRPGVRPPDPHAADDDLVAAVTRALDPLLPPCTRVEVRHRRGAAQARVEVFCGGEDPVMAYRCCRPPGHSGPCYSGEKATEFDATSLDAAPW